MFGAELVCRPAGRRLRKACEMLSCKEASELMSQAQERKLSWTEKLGLKLHLVMCAACSRFARQLEFLQQSMRRYRE